MDRYTPHTPSNQINQTQPTSQFQLSMDALLHDLQADEIRVQKQKQLDAELVAQATLNATAVEKEALAIVEETEAMMAAHNAVWRNDLLELRPYQVKGRLWLRSAFRGMCTFQPGLGKTETAIAVCLCDDGLTVEGPVLIVAPNSLTDMWFDRILKYLPNARIVEVSGTRQQRRKALRVKADFYIVNYEMLHGRPRPPKYTKLESMAIQGKTEMTTDLYYTIMEKRALASKQEANQYGLPTAKHIIFDESHHLKNPQSKRAEAAAELVRDPQLSVTMLTGTPIKRDPDDLYMQMHILAPHIGYNHEHPDMYFPGYHEFIKRYCVSLPSPYGSQTRIVGGRKKPIEELMDKMAFYVSYEEADIYRPDVEHEKIKVRMDAKRMDMYQKVEWSYAYEDINFKNAMEVMHTLRAITACPEKMEAVVDFADEFGNGVYYTLYLDTAHLLHQHMCKRLGLPTDPKDPASIPVLTGEMGTKERAAIIAKRPPHIIGTLGTIIEGFDLSYMRAVHFLEETWTPLEIEQGIDRVRRAGSTATKVNAYYYHVPKTIDEDIHAVQSRRGVTAEMIVRRVQERARKQLRAS